MARRSDHTRDEIKQMCIDAGQHIIKGEGFAQFSARKVARQIGYTIGTIYNVFESHHDFILHINGVTLDDIANFLEKKLKGQDAEAIKQLAEGYIAFAKKDYNRWSALFEHQLPKDQQPPKWYQAKITHIFNIVEAHFEHITTNKEEAHIAAKTIWAGIHGICQLSLTGKLDTAGVKNIKALTNSLIDNYLLGLKA